MRALIAWPARAALVLALALAAPPLSAAAEPAAVAGPDARAAAAEAPRFELIDRGDAVEVIAHHVRASRTAIFPVRSRLEVPITGAPQAHRVLPGDATVKLIELDSESSTRVLSVKLGLERADVKALSRFAQAFQVGDDLHLLLPRKLPADGSSPRLPEPTLPSSAAAPAAAIQAPAPAAPSPAAAPTVRTNVPAGPTPPVPPAAPAPGSSGSPGSPGPVLGPRPDPSAPPPAPVTKPAADKAALATPSKQPDPPVLGPQLPPPAPTPTVHEVTAHPAEHAAPSHPLAQTLATDRDDTWSKISAFLALGLAAAGGGLWLLRRRRGIGSGAIPSIEILAQRSLGGKARIIWLSVGQREMIVAVTARNVRTLGQWRKTGPASDHAARLYADTELHPSERSDATGTFSVPSVPGAMDPSAGSSPGFGPSGPIHGAGQGANKPPNSPAVSGLLRLRGRTGQVPAVQLPQSGRIEPPARGSRAAFERAGSQDSAEDQGPDRELDGPPDHADHELAQSDVEADEAWAKALLSATGGRR